MSTPQIQRFIRRTVEGMQRPPIFEADDGHEYVLKLDTMDPDFPVAELVAAKLAVAFEVPLPDFEVLRVPDLLAQALVETGDPDLVEFGESFQRQGLTCFGSRYLGGVVQKWTARLRYKARDADALLARLLVFDAYIENGDRSSASNPNLLVSTGELFAIDHGQALPSVQGITGKRLPYAYDSHIAWEVVSDRPDLLEAPIADLRRLSDASIAEAVEAVPAAWWSDAGRVRRSIADLRSRRAALPATLVQIMQSLS